MKIIFLGTAGGRICIINQIRASGGWILEMDGEVLHIDPGPGALVRAKQYGVRLEKLTGVLVSHAHPDHYNDAEIIVEAMTLGSKNKKGVLIGNENTINGGETYRKVISPYYLKFLEKCEILEPGKSTNVGKIKVTATPTKHYEEKAIGFVFEGSKKLGYTSDGEYFNGQENHFKGCNYLILNVLRPRGDSWPYHMNTNHACELVDKVKPDLAIINHFGMRMLKAIPDKEAKWIEQQTGVHTIAAMDGLKLDLDHEKEGLEKWIR
jgi:phosphoribosyl 1,2-cyclic phosphodiesterase